MMESVSMQESYLSSDPVTASTNFNNSTEYFTEYSSSNILTIGKIVYTDELISPVIGEDKWISLSFAGLGVPQTVQIDNNGEIISVFN